jgi:hypothetical protein
MTTRKAVKKSPKNLVWRVKRGPTGEIRFFPIKEKEQKAPRGGTIFATMTSKMLSNDLVGKAVASIKNAGGSVTAIRGRLITIETDGENTDAVGEALESFGCQWDLS